jgi:hypothetical protein
MRSPGSKTSRLFQHGSRQPDSPVQRHRLSSGFREPFILKRIFQTETWSDEALDADSEGVNDLRRCTWISICLMGPQHKSSTIGMGAARR